MIVCGLPGAAVERSVCPSWSAGDSLKAFTTCLTSWNAATEVAPAAASTTRNAPRRMRFQSPPPLGGMSLGNAQVLGRDLLLGDQTYKLHKRGPVAGKRWDRHPLLGAV